MLWVAIDGVALVGTTDFHYTAWRYSAGKASHLFSVERTGVAATTYQFDALGRLFEVRDGFSTGNKVTYLFHNKTPFVRFVNRDDLDSQGGLRSTSTEYTVDPFGHVTAIKDGSPQLVHSYGYDSLGRVDRYTDPAGRVQKFLLDAAGRVVEHVRLGDGNDFIHNSTTFEDFGAGPDGRTKGTRRDGLANETITHWDFAGRPFIVQNPGADTVPTAAAPNQAMSLFAKYDGASRLKELYDGDSDKTVFHRDGPGRVLLRELVNQTVNGKNSEDRIAQFNTKDWLRRDALGRIGNHAYHGAPGGVLLMGLEQFEDSLGRVHKEQFQSAFTPTQVLEVASSWTGGSRQRTRTAWRRSRCS